ncbi:MAG: hypothetical protein AAGJ18_10740 [Bacteroidota bacterium]
MLPEGYTKFVSTPAPGWKPPVYGGLFWLNNTGGFKVAKDAFFMNGGGGQRVIISPSENLAIVRLGHSRGVKYCNAAINEALELLMPLL